MTTVLIAPDSFKGTASAAQVAAALAAGWLDVRPHDDVITVPMADGGEGTVDAISAAIPAATRHHVRVTGPDGRPVVATWLRIEEQGSTTAVVELASAAGITLLDAPAPLTSHTIGLGEVMRAALESDPDRLLIGLGGSASTDVGVGALVGLGARLLDASGRDVPPGNGSLDRIARIDWTAVVDPPRNGALVLSDVRSPLLGPSGAVAAFGAQKGIRPDAAAAAETRVAHVAAVIERTRVADPHADGAGAAGGTGFGLRAWGAALVRGADAVGRLVGLAEACARADVVVTGEGRYDGQSGQGKVPEYVRGVASECGVPAILIAGDIRSSPAGFSASVALVSLAGGEAAAMAEPTRWLREAGRIAARAGVVAG